MSEHSVAVDSESVDSESVDSESVDSESVDSESVDSESVDSESVDFQSADSETVGSETVGSETVAASVEDQVLDAARACILEYGVRRTTLAEIARRAQVSRPTVYRRWSDTRAVVSTLLTREIGSVMPVFDVDASVRQQVSSAAADVANKIRVHPLFLKILESDPDILATYILHRLGTSQSSVIDSLAPLLSVGQVDSSVRDGDPTHLAAVVLLMVQSAVQSAAMVSHRIDGDDLAVEIAYAVDAYLRPRDS